MVKRRRRRKKHFEMSIFYILTLVPTTVMGFGIVKLVENFTIKMLIAIGVSAVVIVGLIVAGKFTTKESMAFRRRR